jgi:hypothetical protein
LIFCAKSEIRTALPGKSPAEEEPMRRIGTYSFALVAAAWSSNRPGDRLCVRVGQAGNRTSSKLTRPGSGQPD